ncbi:MAG: hypothetical protein AAGJ56_00025 [Myxococcota bacterium]
MNAILLAKIVAAKTHGPFLGDSDGSDELSGGVSGWSSAKS